MSLYLKNVPSMELHIDLPEKEEEKTFNMIA